MRQKEIYITVIEAKPKCLQAEVVGLTRPLPEGLPPRLGIPPRRTQAPPEENKARYLILLVLRNQVVHITLGFSELHLIHALASVPMQERLATEHSCELLGNAFKDLLNGCGVADECSRHLETSGRNVTHCYLHVVSMLIIMVTNNLLLDSVTYAEFLFWTLSICSSTSFIDILPRKIVATVRYLPCRGSQAAIIFLASNI
ncbi:hypothetical protein B566_EDAN010851 [Ephemera danica]|nr:hypothetical protein B566_EDAN010851 [Ephemera danica]